MNQCINWGRSNNYSSNATFISWATHSIDRRSRSHPSVSRSPIPVLHWKPVQPPRLQHCLPDMPASHHSNTPLQIKAALPQTHLTAPHCCQSLCRHLIGLWTMNCLTACPALPDMCQALSHHRIHTMSSSTSWSTPKLGAATYIFSRLLVSCKIDCSFSIGSVLKPKT